MTIAKTLFAAAVLTMAAHSGMAAAGEFEAGLAAYNAADYDTAYEHWFSSAEEDGDPRSQSGLGFMYLRGLGVPNDRVAAADWFGRAAEGGEPVAQYFLGMMAIEGHGGVKRDVARAYMLCEMASSNGYNDGFSCRERAALLMDSDDRERANQLLIEWRRAHPDQN